MPDDADNPDNQDNQDNPAIVPTLLVEPGGPALEAGELALSLILSIGLSVSTPQQNYSLIGRDNCI